MQQPPPTQPPNDPSPTDPTRRIATPATTVPATDVVYESELMDRIDRARFWANFGAVAATLAAIIGVIALIVALQAKDDANNNDGGNAELRRDVSSLQDDVATLKRQSSNDAAQNEIKQISTRLDKLGSEVSSVSDAQSKTAEDVSQVQKDLTDLTDRVDQVETALEQQSAGGP